MVSPDTARRLRKYERRNVQNRKPGSDAQSCTRRCMTCGAKFLSAGKANRMCTACRAKSVSPFEP